jgi:alkylation response protein AidB-like acyl-CoA dehydrogenase
MPVLEALDNATATLSGELRERADEAEALRTMPPDLVEVARSAGLFRLAMPKVLGGLELDPLTIVSTVEELSRADGSAGWTVLIGNSTAFFAWLDPHVAQAMLGEATDIISTSMFAPMGRARREGNDFVIDGRWPFNSGCMHADWFQTGFMIMDGDAPAMRADGRPDMRFAFFPRQHAEIIDTWHSVGLRGTGSHDIAVHGLRVPEAHTAAPMLDPPVANGGLWQLGFFPLLGVLMSGFPLGVARRALDELAVLAPTKRRGASPIVVADDPHAQYEIGRAEGALQSAKALIADAFGDAWGTLTAGSALTPEEAARMGLAGQQAMNAAVAAVDIAFNFAGAGAVYAGHPLERCFRDIHTANQHIAFSGEGFRGYARTRFAVAG